ncbi:MAG TPA: dockerin type I repeat-containing protein [Tepidisphaeraceae bacterium]|nr:dockerin type I repeat-containing protein [Tepidisphaeraceae bacterium]
MAIKVNAEVIGLGKYIGRAMQNMPDVRGSISIGYRHISQIKLNIETIVFELQCMSLKRPRPFVEGLEARQMMSASIASALLDNPGDPKNVMESFVDFLRDHFAPNSVATPIGTPDSVQTGQGSYIRRPASRSKLRSQPRMTTTPTPTIPITGSNTPVSTAGTISTTVGPVQAITSQTTGPISGDINGDGVVNSDDIALFDRGLAKYQTGAIVAGAATLVDGDVNGDGVVDENDYAVICTNLPSAPGDPAGSVTAPILIPGTGFTGATLQPAAMGTSDQAGYSENAIARWDVVPYQTFINNFNVGVVAFDMSGIKEVDFSVNGSAWVPVRQMTLNTQTANHTGVGNQNDGVVEYWATLNATDYPDGQIEVRAIAVPNVGVPRVLDSLYLNADSKGTLPNAVAYVSPTGSDSIGDGTAAKPFASIVQAEMSINAKQGNVDGATIYLMAGNYTITAGMWNQTALSTSRWLSITHAPGLTKSDVTILGTIANSAGSNDGLQTKLVKVSDVTLKGMVTGSAKIVDSVWYDNVVMVGPGRSAGTSFRESQFDNRYITNSSISDMQDAPDAINIYRGVTIDSIAQSGFHNSPLVINSTVSNIDRGSNTTLHPDAYQFTYAVDNAIAYGLVAQDAINAFGIRIQPAATDVAIVASTFADTAPYVFELERPYTNLLLLNSSLAGQFSEYSTFVATDVIFQNCTLTNPPAPWLGLLIK